MMHAANSDEISAMGVSTENPMSRGRDPHWLALLGERTECDSWSKSAFFFQKEFKKSAKKRIPKAKNEKE